MSEIIKEENIKEKEIENKVEENKVEETKDIENKDIEEKPKKRGRKKKTEDTDETVVNTEAKPSKPRKPRNTKTKVAAKKIPPKRRTIDEIKNISPIREDVVCKALLGCFELKQTKTDKNFYNIDLLDMTGKINGKLWDKEIKANFTEELLEELSIVSPENPIVVAVVAQKDVYEDTPQLKIDRIKILQDENYMNLVPMTQLDALDMYKFVKNYADSLREPYNLVLGEFFGKYGKKFFDAPAAKYYHDNFRCGLLEHTFKMLKAVTYIATMFPTIDEDVLAFMIIMHDFEKIHGYYLIPKPELTFQEIMIGHSVMGATKLHNCLRKYKVPDKIVFALMNSVVAHHGKAEFGSAKPPMTIEAQALMYLDNMISGLAGAEQFIAEKDYKEGKIKEDLYYIDYINMDTKIL